MAERTRVDRSCRSRSFWRPWSVSAARGRRRRGRAPSVSPPTRRRPPRRQHLHRSRGRTCQCAARRRSSRRPRGIVDRPRRRAGADATDAEAAVAAGWAAYKPDAKWPLKVTTTGPTTTAGRKHSATTTRRRRTRGATSAPPCAGRTALDGPDLRHVAGGGREARRAGGADLRPAAAQGIRARDLRRQAGATRSTPRASPSSAASSRRRRSSASPASRSASSRTARSSSPRASACASSASRRRSTPTRCS